MGSSCCTLNDEDVDDRQPLDRSEVGTSTQSSSNPNVNQRQPAAPRRTPQNTGGRRHPTLFRSTGGSLEPSGPSTQAVEQIRLAQRQRIIDQIPSGLFEDVTKKFCNECAICILEFEGDHEVKNLPCMHMFHKDCIDDWLMRHLRCPTCMEPVDAALVSQFDHFASV